MAVSLQGAAPIMGKLTLLGTVGLALIALAASLAVGCEGSISSSVGGSAGSSSSGSLHCEELVKNETATPVDVRLVNHTSEDLYVQLGTGAYACGGEAPFIVKDQNGDQLELSPPGGCGTTCESPSCTCTITYTCAPPPVVRIVPDGTAIAKWSGLVIETRSVPAACIAADCADGQEKPSCPAWIAPETTLSFIGTTWTATQCGAGPCPPCTPNAQGTCEIQYADTAGQAVQATATWSPGATSIDLVFGP